VTTTDEGWPELDAAIKRMILRKRREHHDHAVELGIITREQAEALYALFVEEVEAADDSWREP